MHDSLLKVGDTVRIVEDEYPKLVGVTGTLQKFSDDRMTAWIVTTGNRGVWCSLYNLEKELQ